MATFCLRCGETENVQSKSEYTRFFPRQIEAHMVSVTEQRVRIGDETFTCRGQRVEPH